MRTLAPLFLACCVTVITAVSSWGFKDASLSIQIKKSATDSGLKEKLLESKPLPTPITLGSQDTLKILLTTTEGSKAKRAHQTFLQLSDTKSDLETSFPFQVKESGKGKIDLTHKDIPIQLLSSPGPLTASLIIASFGKSTPYKSHAFDIIIESDPSAPIITPPKPLRYGKLPEIHHIFKPDPTSPPKILSILFSAAVLATLPALLILWISLGANLNHLSKALGSSPIPHALFFSSIVGLEGIFFLYYTHWKLFQVLPTALGVGLVTFLSGSRALREVQQRRLAGLR